MKKLTLTVILSTLALAPSTQAIELVFDKTNYTLQGLIKAEVEKTVKTQMEQLTEVKKMQAAMHGNLKLGGQLGGMLSGYKDQLKDNLFSFNNLKYMETLGLKVDLASLENILEGQDSIFVPAYASHGAYKAGEEARVDYQQESLRNMLAYSELSLSQYEERLGRINSLAQESDKTMEMDEKMDMANRIALETLGAINDLTMMIAQANQIQAIQDYKGSRSSVEEQGDLIKKFNKKRNSSFSQKADEAKEQLKKDPAYKGLF